MPARHARVSPNILDAIGDTPLLEIDGVFAKCEFLNPSGSIKARIAQYIVERAEQAGQLKPGDTIVEATSGNTGNAFAMVAAVKGYRMIVDAGGLSSSVSRSRAYGARCSSAARSTSTMRSRVNSAASLASFSRASSIGVERR